MATISVRLVALLCVISVSQQVCGKAIISVGQVFPADPSIYGKPANTASEVLGLLKNDIDVLRMQMNGSRSIPMLEGIVEASKKIGDQREEELSKFLPSASDKGAIRKNIDEVKRIVNNFEALVTDQIDKLKKKEIVFGIRPLKKEEEK